MTGSDITVPQKSLSNAFNRNSRQRRRNYKYPPPISFRLTADERAALERAAAGLSLSAYIRSRLLGSEARPRRTQSKYPVRDHIALAHLLGLLGRSRIANNLN
jgi:hypothetical protein